MKLFLCTLAVLLVSSLTAINEKKCAKSLAKLEKSCLAKGYEASLLGECVSGDGQLSKKAQKKCVKMEAALQKKCGISECEVEEEEEEEEEDKEEVKQVITGGNTAQIFPNIAGMVGKSVCDAESEGEFSIASMNDKMIIKQSICGPYNSVQCLIDESCKINSAASGCSIVEGGDLKLNIVVVFNEPKNSMEDAKAMLKIVKQIAFANCEGSVKPSLWVIDEEEEVVGEKQNDEPLLELEEEEIEGQKQVVGEKQNDEPLLELEEEVMEEKMNDEQLLELITGGTAGQIFPKVKDMFGMSVCDADAIGGFTVASVNAKLTTRESICGAYNGIQCLIDDSCTLKVEESGCSIVDGGDLKNLFVVVFKEPVSSSEEAQAMLGMTGMIKFVGCEIEYAEEKMEKRDVEGVQASEIMEITGLTHV